LDLRQTIESMLAERLRRQIRVARIERQPFAYQTSAAIDSIGVELDDGTRLELLLKDVSRVALQSAALRTKPDFLYDPLREIEVYRMILAEGPPGTALCYSTVVDVDQDCYWLLLERVRGRELYQIGERKLWEAAAHWLARMHCHWAGRGIELQKLAPVLDYNADYYRRWLSRAAEFQSKAGAQTSGWQRLVEGYEDVIERLTALPKTFLHGEFYASNVLIAESKPNKADKESDEKPSGRSDRPHPSPLPEGEGTSARVCPVDWEMAAVGPGLMDMAALTAGKWSEEERTALLQAYRNGLAKFGSATCSLAELQRDLDFCRLHTAVQWLGWSPDWTPPAEHTHDWLAEAVQLAETLGVVGSG
jgi:thiamine kinase-like enzyme